jgi:DEAD/DEAH box helicase domain-containing protein
LEAIEGNLDHLETVETVSKIDVNPHFDSELESKFIESLRRLSGKDRLPPVRIVQDIVHGKSGYLLEAGSQRYWIEPQVDLGPNEGVLTPSRPDFVLWPAQAISPRKPVAVFCDGWNYHKKITREDAAKRNAILAGGKFWIWSVTWEDVKAAVAGGTETDLAGTLGEMELQPMPDQLKPLCDPRLWTRNSVASLLEWLQTKPDEGTDKPAIAIGRHAAASTFCMVPNPGKP